MIQKTDFQHWKKPFFTIWTGQALSLLTSTIVQFAIIWYLTDTTGSPAVLSIASLAGFLPAGLLGPFAGVFIDRHSRKAIMITADLCIAAASLVIALYGVLSAIPIWLVIAVLFIRSVGTAFQQPCIQAVTPLIVPEGQLTRCNGYSQALQSASMLISPAIAAALYAACPMHWIIAIDIIGALCAVATLGITKINDVVQKQAERPHVLREMADGFQILRARRGLIAIVGMQAAFMIAFMPVNALYPLMSMDYFGGTAWHASLVEITFSVGMLAGALILGVWGGCKNKMHTIALSCFVMGLAMVWCGILPPAGFWLFAILSLVIGLSAPLYNGVMAAVIQQQVPPEFLGRVFSLITGMTALAAPIGLGLSGALGEVLGVSEWFVISGLVTALSGVYCLAWPSLRAIGKAAPAIKQE
mgnify:CR=1 FL=1